MEIEGRAFDVREYFLEDVIQLLNFQPVDGQFKSRKQINRNRQMQDDEDEQGYEDSQADDVEVIARRYLSDVFIVSSIGCQLQCRVRSQVFSSNSFGHESIE